jgi:hypothetical protein
MYPLIEGVEIFTFGPVTAIAQAKACGPWSMLYIRHLGTPASLEGFDYGVEFLFGIRRRQSALPRAGKVLREKRRRGQQCQSENPNSPSLHRALP